MGHNGQFLEMRGISKAFPGVQALDNVDFDLVRGEIHGLIGENGAGKSTLMKVLAGIYQPDGGQIRLQDETVSIDNPATAQRLGISIVHQEPLLFHNLTVAENILVGREPTQGLTLVDRKKLYRSAFDLLTRFSKDISPRRLVRELSVAKQQVVEICKALSLDADILILDEPTSALSDRETEILFEIIRQLREEDIAIVYITHRLNEIQLLADRVTVLRDGKLTGTLTQDEISADRMINMMVGRELSNLFGADTGATTTGKTVVETIDLSGQDFSDVSIRVCEGEIVGLTGLIGSGRSEIGLTLFGHLPIQDGRIQLEGQPYRPSSTGDAIAHGIAFMPEDRHSLGLFLTMPVRSNLSVTRLHELTSNTLVSMGKERGLAAQLVKQLGIRTPGLEQTVVNLSGGNQQKTMLGKWLAVAPKLLIVDEPTRGVDVGAKAEVYTILRQLAQEGIAILMISSEMSEIIGMCDRTYVMHEGVLMSELQGEELTEQHIMALASGHQLDELQLELDAQS